MSVEVGIGSQHGGPPRSDRCAHRWVIEMPNGAKSRGVCKHCGASRAFGNAFEYPRQREEHPHGWPFPGPRRNYDGTPPFDED